MSAPRILAQVVILGSQILGKAFVQAWRQAARNAQASGGAGGTEASSAGGRGAADVISRTHRMTIDEAANILNVKKAKLGEESELQQMLKNFDHLFAANAPTTAEGKPHSSFYLQSKVVRAKERIEAEMSNLRPGAGPAEGAAAAAEGGATTAGAASGKEAPGAPPKP